MIRITPELRKAVNAGVRAICGFAPKAEVGTRDNAEGRWVPNGLNWIEDADLGDLVPFASLTEIDEDPTLPGAATLDLYVTAGRGMDRELECNVYVVIKDGQLADIHNDTRSVDARTERILGRKFSKES